MFLSRLQKTRHWSARLGSRRWTEDYPIPFATPHPLLRRFIPSSSVWSYIDPDLMVTLTFGEDMDQTVVPLPADFVLIVDDVDKTPDVVHWGTARTLVLDYSEGSLSVGQVRCRFSTKTDLFRSILGELITPFDIYVTAP